MDLHIYVHLADGIGLSAKLDQIIALLRAQGVTMAADFAALQQQVSANTDAEQSAVVLLGQLHAMLVTAQASGDPAQVQSVIDQLGSSQTALAKAILDNTVSS